MCEPKLTLDVLDVGTAKRVFELKPLGRITGAMDPIYTGEDSVWVTLGKDIKPEDVVGLEVFVRVEG